MITKIKGMARIRFKCKVLSRIVQIAKILKIINNYMKRSKVLKLIEMLS
jgi:hypothetical protein